MEAHLFEKYLRQNKPEEEKVKNVTTTNFPPFIHTITMLLHILQTSILFSKRKRFMETKTLASPS